MITKRTVADYEKFKLAFEKTQITRHEVATGQPVTLAEAQALINYVVATRGADALYAMRLNTAMRTSDDVVVDVCD